MKKLTVTSIDLYNRSKEEERRRNSNLSDQFHLGGFSTGSSFQDAKTEDAFDQVSDAFLSLFIGGVNNE